MSKIFLGLLLALNLSFAQQWNKTQNVKLKKDEPYRVIFHEQVQGEGGVVQREFVLRWTLFVNEGLTVTIKYDGFNHHHVLHNRYGFDSFRLQLLPRNDSEMQAPYMLIVFQEFDDAQKEAYFELFIKDNDRTNMLIR
jgi:hypothetical protein